MRSHQLLSFPVLAIAQLVASCGAPPEPPKVDVVAKCFEVRDTYCNRSQTCDEQSGDPQPNFLASCKSALNDNTNCSKFTKIIGQPDACLDEINATPCELFDPGTGIPMPASCDAKKLFK
jgi:hypothetical protein